MANSCILYGDGGDDCSLWLRAWLYGHNRCGCHPVMKQLAFGLQSDLELQKL